MHAVTAWSRISATLFVAEAGALGSAVGGLVGGVVGATVTGTLAAMATVFAVAAHVSAVTAARAAAAAGIATAIGFGEVDVPAGVLPGAIAGGDAWAEAGRRCLSLAARGAVQIGLPAVLLGITLSGRPVARLGPMLLAGLLAGTWWGSDRILKVLPSVVQGGLSDLIRVPRAVAGMNADESTQLTGWFAATLVLAALLVWTCLVQDNQVSFRLGLWGTCAGAAAFSTVELINFTPYWFPHLGILATLQAWLKSVQIEPLRAAAEGFVWGGILGWAAHRERGTFASTPDTGSLRAPWEAGLIAAHTILLLASQFSFQPRASGFLEAYSRSGILAALLPLACSLSGRRVPWVVLLPLAVALMAGEALEHAVYESKALTPDIGWLILLAAPVGVACAAAAWAITHDEENPGGGAVVPLGLSLVVSVVTTCGLSAALLDFAWPWTKASPQVGTLSVLMPLAGMLVITVLRVTSKVSSGRTGAGITVAAIK